MPASVTLSDGTVITPGGDPDTVPNIDHGGTAQVIAMDGGAMDGWANIPPGNEGGCDASYNYQCITGYQPSQIPNITGLASAFAISDRFFSLSDSPSWEGHLYAVAASAGGFWGDTPFAVPETASHPGWGCDSGKEARWAPPGGAYERVPSCIPDPALARLRSRSGGAFEATPVPQVPSIMDRLDAAGLPWRIYGAARPGQAGYGKFDICPSFAACLDTAQKGNLVPDSQFLTNAASGTLPAFSVVTPGGPGFASSCHNTESMTACDNWAGQLVSAVESSPDWASTAVFITWDDFGGFYDQVYPGTNSNPDGTQEGPRVPLIIVSPYARPGFTDTSPATLASILRYAEETFGLAPLGANDAGAYDFANAFNYSQRPVKPVRMVSRPLPPSARKIRQTWAVLHDPS